MTQSTQVARFRERDGHEEWTAKNALAVVVKLREIASTTANFEDPLRDAALIAERVLLIALHTSPILQIPPRPTADVRRTDAGIEITYRDGESPIWPLENALVPNGPEALATVTEHSEKRREKLDAIRRLAFDELAGPQAKRKTLVALVADAGYELHDTLTNEPGKVAEGATTADMSPALEAVLALKPGEVGDAGFTAVTIPCVLGAAGSVLSHYHMLYRTEFDGEALFLLGLAIAAAVQDARRGRRAGALPKDSLNHISTLEALLRHLGIDSSHVRDDFRDAVGAFSSRKITRTPVENCEPAKDA